MKRLKITDGGQVSVPAAVRKRWKTRTVVAEDRGDHLVLRPVPDDLVAATRGVFRTSRGPSSEAMRRAARQEERRADERRFGRG